MPCEESLDTLKEREAHPGLALGPSQPLVTEIRRLITVCCHIFKILQRCSLCVIRKSYTAASLWLHILEECNVAHFTLREIVHSVSVKSWAQRHL